jgi:MerR family transcriptional regulator, light-induced transcriptional regulator
VPKPPNSHQEASAEEHRLSLPAAPEAGSDLTWSVGAVSSRLDVTASTLRTWERRYNVGPSFRTEGGHRRYTELDIDRVEVMSRLVGRGISARDAARVARALDRDALALALTEELNLKPAQLAAEDLGDAVLAAAITSDHSRLSQLLVGLFRQGQVIAAWRDILAPALRRISSEVATGGLDAGAASEASELIVRELHALMAYERMPSTGHTNILFARSLPEVEAIPLLVLEVALVQAGVTTHAVGPELDGRAVASLATRLRPDVLVTWGHPPTPPLRRAMGELEGVTSVIRALPAWPKEMSLRFGFEGPVLSTDVSDAVGIILDRVP